MIKKNIETVPFCYKINGHLLSVFTDKLYLNYELPIPGNFEVIPDKEGPNQIYTSYMYMTEGMFGVDWITERSIGCISDIASELNMTEEEAYRYWTPSVIYRKIARALPYSEAFSINRDGTIKIVIYKKTQYDVNHLLNKYCYELVSEEPFEDRNEEPVVILKYKLIIKDIEEHSV